MSYSYRMGLTIIPTLYHTSKSHPKPKAPIFYSSCNPFPSLIQSTLLIMRR